MNKESGKVVILIAHPNIQESNANKELIKTVKENERVLVYDLYDKKKEIFNVDDWSRILTGAVALVFQFPFYWLSAPYMMKRWEDEVLTYLSKTPAIAGKPLTVVVTTGSDNDAYRSGGSNYFTVDELLRPFQAAAIHSGMVWQTPLVVYGMGSDDPAKRIAQGAIQYKKMVDNLLTTDKRERVPKW